MGPEKSAELGDCRDLLTISICTSIGDCTYAMVLWCYGVLSASHVPQFSPAEDYNGKKHIMYTFVMIRP